MPRTVAIPMRPEDHKLFAELQDLSGIKTKADVLRAALRAYERELRRMTVQPARTGTAG